MVSLGERLLEYLMHLALQVEPAVARCAACARIAGVYLKFGNKAGGLAALASGLAACDRIKYPSEKAEHLAWLARLYAEAGAEDQAQAYFKRALLLARAAETAPQKVATLYQIASEYRDAGWKEPARQTLTVLTELLSSLPPEVDTVSELVNVAELYSELADFELVAKVLQTASGLAAQTRDVWLRTERRIAIAGALAAAGNREPSIRQLDEALVDLQTMAKANHYYFWLKIIDVYLTLELETRAADLLAQAAGAAESGQADYEQAFALTEVAGYYLLLPDKPAAARILQKAVVAASRIADGKDQAAVWMTIAANLDKAGVQAESRALAARSQALAEDLTDIQSRLFAFGRVAVLWTDLKCGEKSREVIARMEKTVEGRKLKTGGLSTIAAELADSGEYANALIVAGLVHEPARRLSALCHIAVRQGASDSLLDEGLKTRWQNIIDG